MTPAVTKELVRLCGDASMGSGAVGGFGGGGGAKKDPKGCACTRCKYRIHTNPPAHFTKADENFCCSLCRMTNGARHGGHCQKDMRSDWGIRSTSSSDSRYSNANIINPYSNWRGPVWVNVNAMIIYGT